MNWKRLVALACAYAPGALAAFGVTSGSGYLDVDTGGGLVFRGMCVKDIQRHAFLPPWPKSRPRTETLPRSYITVSNTKTPPNTPNSLLDLVLQP